MPQLLHKELLHSSCDAVEITSDNRFVVATYELQQTAEPVRKGTLALFTASDAAFSKLATTETAAGVLDVKFLPDRSTFAAPLADGRVQMGTVGEMGSTLEGDDICLTNSSEPVQGQLALAVTIAGDRLTTGYSSGTVRQFRMGQCGLVEERQLKPHSHEVWAVLEHGGRIFTGSDDSTLRVFSQDFAYSTLLWRFDAGVTAIERHPTAENCLLVGTYENLVYQFDLRNAKEPLHQLEVGGGVWRIKENPFDPKLVAVAAMYAGAVVIDLNSFTLVDHFKGHESICYGVAWRDRETVLSCSFYDNALCMWRLPGGQFECS